MASEPLYNTGLDFSSKIEDVNYVKLPDLFNDVANSIEAWIKIPTDIPDDYSIGVFFGAHGSWLVDLGPREESRTCNLIEIHPGGQPFFHWNDREHLIKLSELDFRTGEWIHYAVVRDEAASRRGMFTFYVKGEEVYVHILGAGTPVIPRDPFIIGGGYRTVNENSEVTFDGKVGELRVWNTARSAEQIKDNMNKELTGNEEGLLGYWKFDEGEGDVLHDSSPYENHGAIVGAKWYTE